jgi:chemotaxis protein methyltransferase CheR
MQSAYTTGTKLLSEEDFFEISGFIQQHYGIQLPFSKKKMLEARLQKRLKELNLPSFAAYFDYVFKEQGRAEYINMLDIITTNKTDFFREPSHFDYLNQTVLPELTNRKGKSENLSIWSSACSTGEEVYTLLITLEEFLQRSVHQTPYNILGTDLSTAVLKRAMKAVYPEERISGIPFQLKKKYFLRKPNADKPLAKIKPGYMSKVKFERFNLLKSFNTFSQKFDIIFCRNVLIYFNRTVQLQVVSNLVKHLNEGGYLFIGHSESLNSMELPIIQVKPTIYKKI